MKLSCDERLLFAGQTLVDIMELVKKNTKSKYGIKLNVDAFNIASKLRDRFEEYVEQSTLDSIIAKSQKEKLTDKESLFLRRAVIAIFKENSELKNKNDYLLISES